MTDVARQRAVTAHFMAHWGVPDEIHVQEGSRFPLAMLEFAPARQRATYRYATNGMSAIVQSNPKGRYRTELFAGSRSGASWIVRLLATLAAYPIEEETSVGEFHTVPLAGPVVRGRSSFAALLLAPPGVDDAETVGAIIGVTAEPILIHQVVPITEQERTLAVRDGSELLWERLVRLGRPLLIDEERPEVAGGP